MSYTLRNKKTGEVVSFYTETEYAGEGLCNNTLYHLTENKGASWLVDLAENAEYVRLNGNQEYANFESPRHDLDPNLYEVVEVITKFVPVEVSIPSKEEWIELVYRKNSPEHADWLHTQDRLRLSWYNYKHYLDTKEKT